MKILYPLVRRLAANLLLFGFTLTLFSTAHAQNVWRHRACLPGTPRTGCATFTLGTKIYYVGGSLEHSANAINEVWCYDISTNTWAQKNNFPIITVGATAWTINGTGYVGFGCNNNSGGTYYTDFYKYNAGTDSWTSVGTFTGTGRYLGTGFTLNGKGYLVCGKNVGILYDVWEFDPTTTTWTQKANFTGIPMQVGVAIGVGNYGYYGFGNSTAYVITQNFYQYDPSTDTWTQLANFPGTARTSVACFNIGNIIYISSGCDSIGPTGVGIRFDGDCYGYDVTAGTWSAAPDYTCFAPGRSTEQGISCNGHGFNYGGTIDVNGDLANDMLEFGPPDTAFIGQTNIMGADTAACGTYSRTIFTPDQCALWSTGYVGPSLTINTNGKYWVQYNDSCGLYSDTVNLQISDLSITDLVYNTTCGANNGKLYAYPINGIPPYSYAWSNDSAGPTDSGLSPGAYGISITDSLGCLASMSAEINTSTGDTVQITAGNTVICSNDSSQLCLPSGFNTYAWNNGETSQCIYTNQAGNYYATATDQYGCSALSNRVLVQVLPVPPVAITLSGDTFTCYNATHIQWYFNGNPVLGATSNTLIASQPGQYSVTIQDSDGCTATSQLVQYPATTGINSVDFASVTVYPNPLNNGNWTIAGDENIIGAEAEIFDAGGRIIYRNRITTPKFEIDLNTASGIYLLKVTSADKYFVKKLVRL